jgi:DNA-binding NtrC family response regulator
MPWAAMSDSEPIFEPLGPAAEALRSTSVRPLGKLLQGPEPLWFIAPDGKLAYLSAACGHWLGIAPQALLGRSTRGEPTTPLDALAQSLGPARDAWHGRLISHVHPPAGAPGQDPPPPRRVAFLQLPQGDPLPTHAAPGKSSREENPSAYAILAIADPKVEPVGGDTRESPLLRAMRSQLAVDPRRLQAVVMLGASPGAKRLRGQLQLACQARHPVLLVGPTGSGGAALARWIDVSSEGTRVDPHPARVPPALTPEEEIVAVAGPLMDAELLDATTGGLVERFLEDPTVHASLLIEDIDQMPTDAQQRLELLLNNHGPRLRIFATSQHRASQLIEVLRPALASTLGLFPIEIPPLSERREDIPLLATTLLHRRRQRGETRADQIGREALDRLVNYAWPGNFDELDAALRNAAHRCRGETVQLEHLPVAIRSFGKPLGEAESEAAGQLRLEPLEQRLADAEREHIGRALRATGGNRAAAARLLAISRARLLRRIEQLGIR